MRRASIFAAPQWLRFAFVGGIGFLVDGTLLIALVDGLGGSRAWSRIPSFVVAVTVTWWLHRHYTFAHAGRVAPSVREWMRFALANAFGNGVNLALYWALIGWADWRIVPALAVASIVAWGINYAVSARWVFGTQAPPPSGLAAPAKQRP